MESKNVFTVFQDIINGIIAVILMAIMCIILVQTFTRYVIFYSLPWSEEASRYLFVMVIMLGINLGISRNMMVRIDIIDNFLPRKVKKIFETARNCLALFVLAIFFYSTFGMIRIGRFQKSPAMQLSMSSIYIVLCIGFGLAFLAGLLKLIEDFRGRNNTTEKGVTA
jgi:TRAP-type C4-dicarboxylate transport system permease small subunit